MVKRRHVFIHSDYIEDINTAKEKNVWASTFKGNKILDGYFDDSIVYLYFTKFRSTVFYGVAKMKTEPNIPAKKGFWTEDNYGQMFKIEWINKSKQVVIPTKYCGKLLDTNEMDEETGKELLFEFIDINAAKDEDLMKYLKKKTIMHYFPVQ